MSAWRAFQRSKPAIASSLNSARAISTTGIDVLRRPVGVGLEPAHSVGSPAFAIAGRDRRRALRGDLRRRAATLATARLVLGLRPPRARRLDARRLAGLLGVVRRPRRVAQALRLVAARSARAAPPAIRPRRRCPAPGSPIAAKRAGTVSIVNASASTVGTSSQRQRRRDPRVGQRPHRVGATRPSGPWRSGCSRGRRRGAPPSTTSRWPGRARAAPRRGRGRAPRGGPPGTSSAARSGR